jgi:recombination protein RecT
MGGQIVPAKQKFDAIKSRLESPDTIERISRALPKHITQEKMTGVFLTALTTTPGLLNCQPASLLKAVVEASQLGLLPDGVLGHGYILPYGEKAKFIPGFKGLMDLARRSGEISRIEARCVFENDYFTFSYGLESKLEHVPAQIAGKEPGKLYAVYALAKFAKTGEIVFEVMFADDVEKIRKRSPAGKRGPWVEFYNEMARKTVVRKLMKYLPLSPDVQEAVTASEYAEAGVLEKYLKEKSAADLEKPDPLDDFLEGEIEEEPEPAPEPEPEPEPAPEPVPDGAKGKISTSEDDMFQAALNELESRALSTEAGKKNWVSFYGRTLGVYGVEGAGEIRSRDERKRFYKDLADMVVGWEDMETD